MKKNPKDFPEPMNRKKRKLEALEIVPPPPPKPPTKEELQAIEKRDRQFLNALKLQIQPIMDQINRRYKKFRSPAISYLQIKYLFDEMDPNFVRPDLAVERPFELGTDKDGVQGLRETATGKFFYNLETSTIEERLSNGFYTRPKDFLVDIRSLAKDAKLLDDRDRILKANEMLSNVEVDMAQMEAMPIFADAENVFQRQLKRAKEREERHKKRLAEQRVFDPIVGSDLPESELDPERISSGPLTLGEPFPGRLPTLKAAPFRASSGLSNGYSADTEHAQGNGNSVPSRVGDDVQMGGTDEAESQGMQPPHPAMASGPSNLSNMGTTRPNTQISQRSAFQEISHDTSPRDLINDASTTTSGKKTSEGWSTQATNGIISNQNSSSPVEQPEKDSDLPDTQRNTQDTSSEEWPHSQAHGLARGDLLQASPSQTPSSGSQPSQIPAVPSFSGPPHMPASRSRPSGFANLLNDSPFEPSSSQTSSLEFVLDEQLVRDLLNRLVEGSSGCSVEQLEQINRELMETLWKMRGEYNRNLVASKLVNVFHETIGDIEEMQRILQASQL